MTTVSYTQARQNFKTFCDQACNDSTPVFIQRKKGKNVVIISEEDFYALDETAYLLSNPANRKQLKKALKNKEDKNTVSFSSLSDLKNEI